MTIVTPINYFNRHKRLLAVFVGLLCGLPLIHAQSIYETDFERSEGYIPGPLNGQIGWVAGDLVTVRPFSGTQLVELPPDASSAGNHVSRRFNSVVDDSVVYLGFYLSPNAATSLEDLPEITHQPIAALSGLVNRGNGLGEWAVAYGDGSGNGVWQSTGKFIALKENTTPVFLWYVYRLDYTHHVYDFFLDGVLVAENVPFIDASLQRFDQFELGADGKQEVFFDGFSLSYAMPIALDHDEDGLLTTAEDTNGNRIVDAGETDFMSSDTDQDFMGDAIEQMHGFNPLIEDPYGVLSDDNDSGVLTWKNDFEASETFVPGDLNGQSLWQTDGTVEVSADTAFQSMQSIKLASTITPFESFAQHYFGADGIRQVWISFYGKLSAGMLPAAADMDPAAAGVFKLDASGNLAAFDGYRNQWLVEDSLFASGYFNDGDWKHYVIHLDYSARKWTLIAAGGIVFKDIPFDRATPPEFSYFKARQLKTDLDKAFAYIDQLVISDTEPGGLDFDFDGIINQDERDFSDSIGLDLYSRDSDGNGITDGNEDADNDGNNNAYEFAQGRLPDVLDADVALYVDSTLGNDTHYNGLSAMPGRPTLADGPKASIQSAFLTATDSDIVLIQSGTFTETTLKPNGKNLTLRVNGPVTLR